MVSTGILFAVYLQYRFEKLRSVVLSNLLSNFAPLIYIGHFLLSGNEYDYAMTILGHFSLAVTFTEATIYVISINRLIEQKFPSRYFWIGIMFLPAITAILVGHTHSYINDSWQIT